MTLAARRAGARRAPLLLAAGLCLLAGLDAALLLLGLPAPVTSDRLPQVHGVLLVLGFAGTLVALERAVALGSRWGYLAPAGLGAGGLLLLTPVSLTVPRLLLVAGSVFLAALYLRFWRRQPSAALLAQAAGAVSAIGAALLWLGGLDIPRLLPWLVAFLVLTIAGERLELARVAVLTPHAEPTFLACVAAVLTGVATTLMWPGVGTLLLGAALLALVAWLVAHDVARRLLRSTGLPRFTAACLLAGYAWLGLAGALWLLGGPVAEGHRYDAVVHAVFLGFVMSMIMAHAPVILPAVLRRPLPYHPGLAVAAWLLHLSLALRVVVGDLREIHGAWQLGGALNIAAVLLFVLTAATSSVAATRRTHAGPSRPAARTASAAPPVPDAPLAPTTPSAPGAPSGPAAPSAPAASPESPASPAAAASSARAASSVSAAPAVSAVPAAASPEPVAPSAPPGSAVSGASAEPTASLAGAVSAEPVALSVPAASSASAVSGASAEPAASLAGAASSEPAAPAVPAAPSDRVTPSATEAPSDAEAPSATEAPSDPVASPDAASPDSAASPAPVSADPRNSR